MEMINWDLGQSPSLLHTVGGSDFSLEAIANVFMHSASDLSINLALHPHLPMH